MDSDSILALAKALPTDEAKEKYLSGLLTEDELEKLDAPLILFEYRWQIAQRNDDFDNEVDKITHYISECLFQNRLSIVDSLASPYLLRIKEVSSPIIEANFLHTLAKSKLFVQQYAQGIELDSQALRVLESEQPEAARLITQIHLNLGRLHNANGQFIEAAAALTDGVKKFKSPQSDSITLLETYNEIGVVYSQIGLYDKAVEYLDRSEQFGDLIRPLDRVILQANTARNFILTHDYTKARDRYLKGLSIKISEKYDYFIFPYLYNGLVESNYYLNQTDSLNHYFNKFTAFINEAEGENHYNFLYKQSKWLHDIQNGHLVEAEKEGLALYQEAIDKNDIAEKQMYAGFLADTYSKTGNYQQAYHFTQLLMNIRDSVQSANRNNALLLYYNQFETQEKENQILVLDQERERAENRRRQYQIITGLLLLLLLTGLFFYFKLRSARHQLTHKNEELTELNQTKDRFFSIIAHDLRGPIVALKGADRYVSQLYEKGDAKEVKNVVGLISQTAGQLNGLLDNLLKWALNQSFAIKLNKSPQPLDSFVEESIQLYAPAASTRNITLINNIPVGSTVLADKDALLTILRNFLSNAVKFSEEGGDINIDYQVKSGMHVITVRDEGKGLSEHDQAQLFNLHWFHDKGGKRKSGTGLGLILCRDLAKLHGGRIELDSKPGKGASFSVWLPRD